MKKYDSIGNRIKHIRDSARLSQAKFSVSLGISRPSLSAIENGLVKPSMPVLYVIEAKYGYRHEWVLTGDEPIFIPSNPIKVPIDITPLSEQEVSIRSLIYWEGFVRRIFEEGDKKKIDLLKAQLRALDPGKNDDSM